MKTYFEMYAAGEISYAEFKKKSQSICESNPYNSLGLTSSEFALYQRLGESALEEIISARAHKKEIMQKWKRFFREEIAEHHINNTLKLKHLKAFNLNPFLDKYKANFLLGNSSPKSIATALVYARTLSASINTIFGTSLQKFCSNILSGYASTTSGIDIEFIDFVDGKKKYCQIKAGPNTINKDDVKTILDHFAAVKNLARTNHLDIGFNDLIVGVFYGEPKDLSNHYKQIQKDHPIHIGKDFWYRLTGDEGFYDELTSAIDEVAYEYDARGTLELVIESLSKEIEHAED